ncbi:hypothetical protein [Pseudonocardia asaccharolytica]|uniref:Uncharacterized protein n=1 Tax=Pseudonocardia asaccharolytica DSM 44247 = NBRC 16224 TaxID=1123024 RepID=A0A511CUC1_9PSEU|nr:hypothetical protein [Pseudonocardia asaccharolytica]GEL16165.1 hypothetical protein PA7_00020 [Pseudonocardia asaccharolytica DSM 44247 = NBRC 16224]
MKLPTTGLYGACLCSDAAAVLGEYELRAALENGELVSTWAGVVAEPPARPIPAPSSRRLCSRVGTDLLCRGRQQDALADQRDLRLGRLRSAAT